MEVTNRRRRRVVGAEDPAQERDVVHDACEAGGAPAAGSPRRVGLLGSVLGWHELPNDLCSTSRVVRSHRRNHSLGCWEVADPVDVDLRSRLVGWTFIVRSDELQAWRRCRRAWDLGAGSRQRYAPRVLPPFDFDRAMHSALATYYLPAMDDWSRSIVRPLALKAFEQSLSDGRARHEASTPLSPGGEEDFHQQLVLGAAMLTNFFVFAAANDDFDSILSDHDVWAPIADPNAPECDLGTPNGRPVRYLGRIDQLIGDTNDEFWVVDHQVVSGTWQDDESLVNDDMVLGDCWALQVAFPQLVIAGTVTNELLTDGHLDAEPPGEIIERDLRDMSGSRHVSVLRGPAPPPLAWASASMTESDHITEQHDDGRCRRTVIRRSPVSIAEMGRRNAQDVTVMLHDDKVAVPPHFAAHCANCVFKRPCDAMVAGRGWQSILAADYVQVPDPEQVNLPGGKPKTVNLRWG